nr:hypothetical protein [Zobellia laminariae]
MMGMIFLEEIVKEYSANTIKIEITPISFTENPNNKVLYKLSGYDENWNVFKGNPILYEDLPHGNYTLTIANSLAENENTNKYINIIIKKPFYKSVWFFSLLLLVLLAMFGYWAVARSRSILRNQKN